MVQASQAEKNRQANAAAAIQKGNSGPMRLYVGSLHFNITEDMLRGIFEPFGKVRLFICILLWSVIFSLFSRVPKGNYIVTGKMYWTRF